MQPQPMQPWTASIENIPVEIARSITVHLRPASLANLLEASPAVRRLFTLGDSEIELARKLIIPHWKTGVFTPTDDIPFQRLPDVFAVSWISATLGSWRCRSPGCAYKRHHPCVEDVFVDN
ncbi:hypothetical protein HDU96_010836 [Phlyctochytrium bullatum]|nr:hypothetical protein HDU96_010836 [Phlyctochytrium bullatum]